MRAFIALPLPEPFEDELAALARQLGEQVKGRFLHRSTYHVTLAFLGEIDDAGRAAAMDALDAACAGMPPVQLAPDGLGKFGHANDASLWMGLQADDALYRLAARLREELDSRGVSFDPKPFRAHITLARRAHLPKGQLAPLPFPNPVQARTATLFKSIITHEGATYKPLYSVELGEGEGL